MFEFLIKLLENFGFVEIRAKILNLCGAGVRKEKKKIHVLLLTLQYV